MPASTIIVSAIAILFFGLAIYLWIDRKNWIKKARDAAETCKTIKEVYKELGSFVRALDEENVELTVKCNQYEALLQTKLDEIPVADISGGETVYQSENEDDGVGGWSKDDIDCNSTSFKKPCCSCWNGVYNPTRCVGCTPESNYENYTVMKYE